MTISPPTKVKNYKTDPGKVLCSNIDKLDLAFDIEWFNPKFFERLSRWKAYAAKTRESFPTVLYPYPHAQEWKCLIKPHGSDGYEWLIDGNEFFLKIGNWLSQSSRPSVMVEIRSETLWRLGPKNAIYRIARILKGQGGDIVSIKPSRVDLCVDILLNEEVWNLDLVEYSVTRALSDGSYRHRKNLTGISIGKGTISARLYDKPLEIKQQSKKFWVYKVWGLDEVPDGKKIIRVEFQLRRKTITGLGINKIGHFLSCIENVWAYCTKKWLKFQNNPGNHHTMRKTFSWWETVQKGFNGCADANPLIRFDAVSAKASHLHSQAYGLITSLEACSRESFNVGEEIRPDLGITLDIFKKRAEVYNEDGFNFADKVFSKQAKYNRTDIKMLEVAKKRKRMGFPSNFSEDQLNRAKWAPLKLKLADMEERNGTVFNNKRTKPTD